MAGINGIGKIGGPIRIDRSDLPQIIEKLKSISTPRAQAFIFEVLKTEGSQNRVITLYKIILSVIGLENKDVSEKRFADRFEKWEIRELDKERSPNSPNFHVRYLLEKVFGCQLAYERKTKKLQIIALGEFNNVEYQWQYPFPEKESVPFTSSLPPIIPARMDNKSLAKPVTFPIQAAKIDYKAQIKERICEHIKEGRFKMAALLLFRESGSIEILKIIEEAIIKQIMSKDFVRFLFNCQKIKLSEITAGFLMQWVHPVTAARFIEELASHDIQKAVMVLGCLGKINRQVIADKYGDIVDYGQRSCAGYVLSVFLNQRNYSLANKIVAIGIKDPRHEEVYARCLKELQANFNENIFTPENYINSNMQSLFTREIAVPQQNLEEGQALVLLKNRDYAYGGSEFYNEREFNRGLAKELVVAGELNAAWEFIVTGRPLAVAFNDFNKVLSFKDFGRLLRSRGFREVAEYITAVLREDEDLLDPIACVLRYIGEDLKATANIFELMIEADRDIPGSRQIAYDILDYGAHALESKGLEPLLNAYHDILQQIETDKNDTGWFSAKQYLLECRFLNTDAPGKARKVR